MNAGKRVIEAELPPCHERHVTIGPCASDETADVPT